MSTPGKHSDGPPKMAAKSRSVVNPTSFLSFLAPYYCFSWDPVEARHMAVWSKCFYPFSLTRNQQLQRTEVDMGKKLVFTNNIPKAGFLINPQDPIPRRRHGVSLSLRLWEKVQIQCQARRWRRPGQPLSALDHTFSSQDVSAFLVLGPEVTSETINCWRTEGLGGSGI